MRHGFIKVVAATPALRVADCAYNREQIARRIAQARERGAQLLVLPELCLTGYTCGDLFLQDALLNAAEQALLTLVEQSAGSPMVTVLGVPLRQGDKLYNCAAVVQNGRLLGVIPKRNLPNYGEFYELRHFSPAPQENGEIRLRGGVSAPFGTRLLFACAGMPQFVLGVEVCEDLWVPAPPSVGLATAGASVIANLSASDETIGKDAYRRALLTGQSARLCCGYLYADAGEGESTGDMVFAGHDLIAENGVLLAEAKPFGEGFALTELDLQRIAHERRRMNTFQPPQDAAGYDRIAFDLPFVETALTRPIAATPFIPADEAGRNERCEGILRIQAHGLKRRLEHSHSKTAVVGVSGGLDSTLALLVAAKAMDLLGRPRADIVAVTMPCFGTTSRTRSNAERLCDELGIPCQTVDISAAVRQHFQDIGQPAEQYDVTFENAQARERTQVLMDIANRTGGLVVGTGDLSELALGWATYNGDHMSMYGVNASIPKTLIRHIVRHEAEAAGEGALKGVLLDILDTPVSPELLPAQDGEIAQKTEHIVGPYALHDFFLYWMVRWGAAPDKILRLACYAFAGEYEETVVRAWLKIFLRRFFQQQFKRSCLPDGPKVGSVTLSPRGDWRMPSDACADVWSLD